MNTKLTCSLLYLIKELNKFAIPASQEERVDRSLPNADRKDTYYEWLSD